MGVSSDVGERCEGGRWLLSCTLLLLLSVAVFTRGRVALSWTTGH